MRREEQTQSVQACCMQQSFCSVAAVRWSVEGLGENITQISQKLVEGILSSIIGRKMIELALRRHHVQLILLSSFKKRGLNTCQIHWYFIETFTCASNRWFLLCIRVFVYEFFVCSQKWWSWSSPSRLRVIALIVYWSGTSKRFSGFLQTHWCV